MTRVAWKRPAVRTAVDSNLKKTQFSASSQYVLDNATIDAPPHLTMNGIVPLGDIFSVILETSVEIILRKSVGVGAWESRKGIVITSRTKAPRCGEGACVPFARWLNVGSL
jgi:hypothetical protein